MACSLGNLGNVFWFLNLPTKKDRSRESLGQKLQNSYCTKGQYRHNCKNVKAFRSGKLPQTVSRLWKSRFSIYCAGATTSCGGAAASTVTCAGIGRYPLRVRSLIFFIFW